MEGVGDYAFARHVNSVPLMAVETPMAAREYVIVFVRADESVMPVALLGVESDRNGYVTATGGWDARYVPAFVRRYPFVFSRSEDGTQFTLCIDESWSRCNEDGRGQRLFNDQGERTPYLDNMLSFLQEYNTQLRRTEAFCKKLVDLDLLEPIQVQFTLAGGPQRALGGFLAVSRVKLKTLPAEQLGTLVQTDELELLYQHLHSLNNFLLLAECSAARGAEAPPPEAPRAEEPSPAIETPETSPEESREALAVETA